MPILTLPNRVLGRRWVVQINQNQVACQSALRRNLLNWWTPGKETRNVNMSHLVQFLKYRKMRLILQILSR